MSEQGLSILLGTLVAVFSLGLIGFLVGRHIYKRVKGLPTGDCACCKINSKKLIKQYHKEYANKQENKSCCCCQNNESKIN